MMKTMIGNVKKLALLLILVFGMSALLSAQSKTPVKVADLQKSIIDKITKDYAGYTIKDAYKIDKNKVITYDVNVLKSDHALCLAFDNNGKFLNVVEPKSKNSSKPTSSNSTSAMNGKNKTKTQH
jgi:hypothetical protein